MIHCRVDGNATTTISHPSVQGWTLLVCQPLDDNGADKGEPLIALDTLGAGLHTHVLVSTDGQQAEEITGDPKSPLRNTVLGIIDPQETPAQGATA